jgi:putative transposase
MDAVMGTGSKIGVAPACAALGLPRATYYRRLRPKPTGTGVPGEPVQARRRQPRALPPEERQQVLAVLNEPRFVDLAPPQVHATLLDEKKWYCSLRTMYRILDENDQVRERRDQLRHPEYKKPELMATNPNQVWTWDITKLLGPAKWTYFYLYVILDIFSRYVVGWTLASRECASVAHALIEATYRRHGIAPDQLTLHADRGAPMTSKPVAFLLADLAVTKSHSRPHVSDDNPFSEAQFKTLKYRPDFPARFGSEAHARSHCRDFFSWYNREHRHTGIGLFTPHDVHHGLVEEKRATRAAAMAAAYHAHPERFPHGTPRPPELPVAVWINKPQNAAGAAPAESACQRAPQGAQAGDAAASKLLVLAAPSGNSFIELAP